MTADGGTSDCRQDAGDERQIRSADRRQMRRSRPDERVASFCREPVVVAGHEACQKHSGITRRRLA